MSKRPSRPARLVRRAGLVAARRKARKARALMPLQLAEVWPLQEAVGDRTNSPATNLLGHAGDGPHAVMLQRWPLYVHRPGYRLAEHPTCIQQLATAAGVAARDMAQSMLSLERAGLLIWFPEYQLYVLNSVEWGEVEQARLFSDLLWRLGHVPQPDRPSDRWKAELVADSGQLRVCRADTGDEL